MPYFILYFQDPYHYSGVASPEFWGEPKNFGRPKYLILGENHYFAWNIASQRAK